MNPSPGSPRGFAFAALVAFSQEAASVGSSRLRVDYASGAARAIMIAGREAIFLDPSFGALLLNLADRRPAKERLASYRERHSSNRIGRSGKKEEPARHFSAEE